MAAPHPDNPMPYGIYFIAGFILGAVACGLAVSLLRDLSMAWPVGARMGLALSPLVVGAFYGARVFTFGRAGKLGLKQALRRGLPGMGP